MTANQAYVGLSALAFVPWLLLMLAPRSPLTRRLTGIPVFSLAFAALYVLLFAAFMADFLSLGGYASIDAVQAILAHDGIFLAAWIHYLAFDLLVGTWMSRDALQAGVSRLLVAPCLLLTYLFGPAGWLLYLLLRRASTGTWPVWPN
jgi:hypothetical protein